MRKKHLLTDRFVQNVGPESTRFCKVISPEMTKTAIESLEARKRGEEFSLDDVLAKCWERRIPDPDPVVLVTLQMVRHLGYGIRRVPVSGKHPCGTERVCWLEDGYRELLTERSPLILNTPELADALNIYHEATGRRFRRAKPEDHFPRFIPRPTNPRFYKTTRRH